MPLELSRPSWQQKCPQWCLVDHDESDSVDDQVHRSQEFRTFLTQPIVVSSRDTPLLWATMHLSQPTDQLHPRIWLGAEDTAYGANLTTFEAHYLAKLLLHIVEIGEGS